MTARSLLTVAVTIATALPFARGARGACYPGQMAKLKSNLEVRRSVPGSSAPQVTTLTPGAEVHVVAVDGERIEVYAIHGTHGEYVNGLGEVKTSGPPILDCQ